MVLVGCRVCVICVKWKIGEFVNMWNGEIIIVVVVWVEGSGYMVVSEWVVMVEDVEVVKGCGDMVGEVVVGEMGFIGVDRKGDEIEIGMGGVDGGDVGEGGMVKGIGMMGV